MPKLRWQSGLMFVLVLSLLAVAGCWFGSNGQGENQMSATGDSEFTEIALYFCDQDGHLRVELRELTTTDNLPEAALRELIRGPATPELLPTIPEGTVLKSIVVTDGLAKADFNSELKTNHWGGSLGEMITVYSIVNTLTQFPEIERVQILIESQEVESLAGHLDLSEPLDPSSDLVKE
jgi:spore germination protein GerM